MDILDDFDRDEMENTYVNLKIKNKIKSIRKEACSMDDLELYHMIMVLMYKDTKKIRKER